MRSEKSYNLTISDAFRPVMFKVILDTGGLINTIRLTAHPPDNQWERAFIGGGKGLHAEIAQSALTVILKLAMWWTDQCHLDCLKYS